MELCGTIHANLRAALHSARRLRGGPVHPDTVEHWAKIVAVAKSSDGALVTYTTRALLNDLEREVESRQEEL